MKSPMPTDPALSPVAWGSWRCVANPAIDTPDKLARLLEGCVAAGITTIDLADIYGGFKVEPLVGAALAQAGIDRSAIQLVGKCGIRPVSPARPENRLSFYAVAEAFLAEHLGGGFEPIGQDFRGASLCVPEGAREVPGLAEALESKH